MHGWAYSCSRLCSCCRPAGGHTVRGASEMGSATIKGLIKFRIRRECCIATDGLSVVLCTDSISAYREGKGAGGEAGSLPSAVGTESHLLLARRNQSVFLVCLCRSAGASPPGSVGLYPSFSNPRVGLPLSPFLQVRSHSYPSVVI